MELECLSLFSAVCRNDVASVQQALRNGADVNYKNGLLNNATPLMQACEQGYAEIVQILLDAGADWVSDIRKFSPMYNAIREGHLSAVETLVNHAKDHLEFATPLISAKRYQRVGIVRFLLDCGANAHAAVRTELMYACSKWNLAIVHLLLAAGLDVEARNADQKTAIISGAQCQHVRSGQKWSYSF